MRRVGKRGEGNWKRVTWEEALAEVAEKLGALRDQGRPEEFMFHYGRMKASSESLIKMFLSAYGTDTIGNHTSICEGGKWTAQELTWGTHYDNWDFDNTRYVLNFGSNFLEAHTNHTPVAYRFVRAMAERNVRLVTFDVRLSNTAAVSNEWVPIRSGTDGAVVLAMCNVIMQEGLYADEGEAFLDYCKVSPGRDASRGEKVAALKAYLATYTPEWAAEISGVSADKIRRIAIDFATTKPACAVSYRGAIAHYNGNDTERAIQMLAAITGNIDNPGGRCKAVSASWKKPDGPADMPKAKKLSILDGFPGQAVFPTHHISHQVFKMIKDGSAGRPQVYLWYCYQPVYSNPDVAESIEVLSDEELIPFTVCVSPFYDESAALADLILPDATYLERWDWETNVSPNQVPEYYIRQPAVAPLGETRDFGDVVCDLAKQMGFPLGFDSKQDYVAKTCDTTPGVREAGGFEYMKTHGVWHDPAAQPRYYSYSNPVSVEVLGKDGVILDEATGVLWNWKKSAAKSADEATQAGYRATKNAYKGYVGQTVGGSIVAGFMPDKLNKSGLFELYSDLMEEKGLPPLPTYIDIPEHKAMKVGEMILTTYKVAVQTHSRTQNSRWLTEIYHDNPAWMNPASAADKGIADGDRILVRSSVGEIEATARVTPGVVPGVIAISFHCGHWQYGRYASGKRAPAAADGYKDRKWWTANGVLPNWIIPADSDPINGQERWMDTVVTVERIQAGA